jgi:hypothetical protein
LSLQSGAITSWLLRLILALIVIGFQPLSAASLTGRVTDHAIPTNYPIPGARIVLTPEANNGQPRQAITDANGVFTFADLAAGDYALKVEAVGFMPRPDSHISIADGADARMGPIILGIGGCGGKPLTRMQILRMKIREFFVGPYKGPICM